MTSRTSEWMAEICHRAMLDKEYNTLHIEDDLMEFTDFDYDDFSAHFDKFEILPNGGIFLLDPRSNMKKAIKITEDNLDRLVGELNLDPSELDQDYGPTLGFWIIADFGAQRPEAYLTEEVFNETFDIVPPEELTLRNDWVPIADKKVAA